MSIKQKKIALVTGATRGIGLETARQLAEHGIRVLIGGRTPEKAANIAASLQAGGFDVEALTLDVTQLESIAAAASDLMRKYGHLDILINNAGIRIEEYGKHPSEQSLQHWRDTFDTNFFGVVAVTQAFLPLLRKSNAGRIVNVSSLLASLATHSDSGSYAYSPKFKSLPAYSASKSAMNSWTVHLAYELRHTPIKVNAAHPGYTRTDMNAGEGDLDVVTGARTSVRLALLDVDGPSGGYFHMDATVPW
jgi:NAD(P)-dependent dehydrogenase (short-subunit alcohol dehydrogenase family)